MRTGLAQRNRDPRQQDRRRRRAKAAAWIVAVTLIGYSGMRLLEPPANQRPRLEPEVRTVLVRPINPNR